MANKLLSVTVRGKSGKAYAFNFYGDPCYLQEWRDDDLEIDEILNIIPMWVVNLGLTIPWCFLQDIFHLRNPFEHEKLRGDLNRFLREYLPEFEAAEHHRIFLQQIEDTDKLVMEAATHKASEPVFVHPDFYPSVGIYGSIPGRTEAFPPGFIVFLDRPITREEAEHTYPRTPYTVEATMKDPQDVMPDHSASAMRALGEMCFKLFSDPRFEKRNFQAAYDLAKELLSLDYSPVMRHFLERGLHTVKYYSDIDGFVFTFNAGSALHFTRGDKVWAMTGDEDLVRRGTIKPQPLTATGVSAALAPISNCPLCSSIVVSTDRYCHHCAYDLSQVYPGTPVSVLMCPGCGSVGCFNGSQCAACGYPAAQAKQPAPAPMPGLAPGGSWDPGPAVRMRCPGGCGSEIIGVYPASPDGENPFKSLCPYSCKVRVEVWNKKLQEAKKR